MGEAIQAEMVFTVFTFVDLCRLYSTRIEELGVLKRAQEGRDIPFTFQEDIGQALRKACELVAMVHGGASIKAQSNSSGMTQTTLSTAQLLQ